MFKPRAGHFQFSPLPATFFSGKNWKCPSFGSNSDMHATGTIEPSSKESRKKFFVSNHILHDKHNS